MFENKTIKNLQKAKSIAIVGAKDKPNQPVNTVGEYLIKRGFTVYPIHPVRENVWGLETFKSLAQLAQKLKEENTTVDIICLFRASEYCLDHAKEAFENGLYPSLFWLQEGIKSQDCFNYIQENKGKHTVEYIEDLCVKTLYHSYFPNEFECARCGICCSGEHGIVIDDNTDLPRLLSYFNCSIEELDEKYTMIHNNKRIIRANLSKNCLFFEEGKGCNIHPARPDICRAWPYFRGNMVDNVSFEMAKEDCHGIMRNALHSTFRAEGIRYLESYKLLKDVADSTCANALKYNSQELSDLHGEEQK